MHSTSTHKLNDSLVSQITLSSTLCPKAAKHNFLTCLFYLPWHNQHQEALFVIKKCLQEARCKYAKWFRGQNLTRMGVPVRKTQ